MCFIPTHGLWRPLLALLGAALSFSLPVKAQSADEQRAIQAVRLAVGEVLTLNGRLDHPAWQRAPAYDRFIEKDPVFGAEPPQRTRVQVLFDDQALYVGVTALDSRPREIRDPMVRNDQVNRTQDFIALYIDAIGSKRAAQFFRANAAGSLGDGLHTANDDSEDFSPDFDWDAAVHRDASGYSVVYRLPFASLRYGAGPQNWRIMVVRRLPRAQFHLVSSVPIPRELPSFIDNMQPLLGVQLPADNRFLTLRPALTLRRDEPAAGAASTKLSASLDAKWRPVPQAVVDATLNPDFSQVALDVPQLAGNARFALFYPEKRPFFFESADLLRTPTEAFYTRSFTEPRWGLRGTWRSADWAGTALAVDDRGKGLVLLPSTYGTHAVTQPASRVLALRARSDSGAEFLPGGLQLGAVAAAREYTQGQGSNRVLGPDLAWQLSDHWRLRGQWLHSQTTALPDRDFLTHKAAVDGDLLHLRLLHQTHRSEINVLLEDIHQDFRHDSGFVNQVGVRKWRGFASYGWMGLGPFNQFWINSAWERVTDRVTGALVAEYLRPGLWSSGASNLEWWAEYFGHSVLRTKRGGPLRRENFVATGLVLTPAPWFPILDTKLELGRFADTAGEGVSPGGRYRLQTKLRPLPQLELESLVNAAWLRDSGVRSYSETAWQGLAVWHFNARHNLRAIVNQSSLKRRAQEAAGATMEDSSSTLSLTYGWREAAGTVLYVGYSSAKASSNQGRRDQEVFVKWQVDVDQARQALRRR